MKLLKIVFCDIRGTRENADKAQMEVNNVLRELQKRGCIIEAGSPILAHSDIGKTVYSINYTDPNIKPEKNE